MAEVAGLVIGGVGLVALFDSCMSGFQYLEAGANYGRDYNKAALKVSLNQLRLAQWRNSVELVEDPQHGTRGLPIANSEQTAKVQELLEEIQDGFEVAEKTAQRHKLKKILLAPEQQAGAETATALVTTVKARALQRQDKSSLKQKALWALHDQRKLTQLIDDQKEYITALVDLFPAISSKQLDLAKMEAAALLKLEQLRLGSEAAAMLDEASNEVYPELGMSLKEATPGSKYTFSSVKTMGQARVQNGNYVAKDYQGGWIPNVTYNFGDVEASDHARQHNGDNYGGKSVYDD